MLKIQIGSEFLDLYPNTVIELEEENPFLQLGEEIQGQYSLPVTIPSTAKNLRILGHPNIPGISRNQQPVWQATVWNERYVHSIGQIRLESGKGNLMVPHLGDINVYYLFGITDFYKTIEKKTLRDLDYGPTILIHFNSNVDREDPNYFWGWIGNVMKNGTPWTHDFAIFPLINESDTGSNPGSQFSFNVLNSVYLNPANNLPVMMAGSYGGAEDRNQVCPFPYLSKVLQRIFQEQGWKVDGDMFNSSDFRHIVILHNYKLDYETLAEGGPLGTFVELNLRECLPNIKVSTFLIALANRFCWHYDFDYRKKVCIIRSRSGIFASRQKRDFSRKVGANFQFVSNKKVLYALKQANAVEKPDFSKYTYAGIVNNKFQIPIGGYEHHNKLFFVQGENSWYVVEPTDPWKKITDNNFDFVPTDFTDEITTGCLVPGTQFLPVRDHQNQETYRYACMPAADIVDSETDTFYLCYHHGLTATVNRTAPPLQDYLFPQSHAGCHSITGTELKFYSLTFEYPNGLFDRGLYKNNWQYFLKAIAQTETITLPVSFSFSDMVSVKWHDTIVIRGTEYIIKNPHFTIPIQQYSNMELVKI